MIGALVNMIMCAILAGVIVSVIRHLKLVSTYILKIVNARNIFLLN